MRKLLIIMAALLLYPATFVLGAEAIGFAGVGSFQNEGEWSFATVTGANISIFTVSDSGKTIFQQYIKTEYMYVDSPDDIQAMAVWSVSKKSLGLLRLYTALGLGISYQFQDKEDLKNAGLMLELGYEFPAVVSVFAGYEHIPKLGFDYKFFYLGLDLNL